MNKFAKAAAVVMGVGVSAAAMAAPSAFTVTTTVTGQTTGACPLLIEDTKLAVSTNVVGAWQCDEATAVIKVAACHQGGSRNTGVACSTDDDDSTTAWDAPGGCTTNTGNSSIPSFIAFGASSEGGTMGEYAMDQRCVTGQITGISLW